MYSIDEIIFFCIVLCLTPIFIPIFMVVAFGFGYFILVMHIGLAVYHENEMQEQGKSKPGWFSTWINVMYFILSLPVTIPYSILCIIFKSNHNTM